VSPLDFDTMIAAWVLDPASYNLGLKKMADLELNISMTKIAELIGSGRGQLTMDAVSIEDTAPYAAADAEVPPRLMKILQKRLEKNDLLQVFRDIEMPMVPVLVDMEYAGIAVDRSFFADYSKELSGRMMEIQREVYDLVGHDFNLNSTQQLSAALFETLGLIPPDSSRKTKSGYYSTAASVLEEMQE